MPDQSAKDSERLLAEALRAKAGGGNRSGSATAKGARDGSATGQPLTLVQLVLASLIGGLVVGILLAVLTLL